MIRSVVRGFGTALPKRVLTNAELESMVDTSDEWIVQRTGIRQRYIAGEGETTASLGEGAARAALENAGLTAADIDLIIVATSTPDNTFPATAVNIQNRLGMSHGFAFDVQAVCSGFVYAVTTADAYIRGGLARRVLVIGAETFSRILDWTDRTTCVLFGDGAGAIVLEAQEGAGTNADRGVLSAQLRSDGAHRDKLFVDGGPSTTGTVGHLRMEGREVFKHAVGMITDVIVSAFDATGFTADDVTASRPAPYMIFRAMELAAVRGVDRVLAAGDTPNDLAAGRNAGVRYVVAVTTGATPAAELGRHRHTHLLESVADLPALLRSGG